MLASANLCTHAPRVERMRPTIQSLVEGGFSVVRVWLNDIEPPSWAGEYPTVLWHRGEDRADGGKFGFMGWTNERYYLAMDDDIIYPKDYLSKSKQECNASQGVSSFLGWRYKAFPISCIYERTADKFLFTQKKTRQRGHVLGTGLLCIDRFRFKHTIPHEPRHMIDIHLAIVCKQNGITPMVGACDKGWIKDNTLDSGIFGTRKDKTHETALLNAAFAKR